MSITRVDRSGMQLHGWLVSVVFLGTTKRRLFSDLRYGSSSAAHRRAQELNDALSTYAAQVLSIERRLRVRRTSKYGTPGITFVAAKKAARSYWLAYWINDEGRRVRRRFSISRYGPDTAMRLALETRLGFAARDAERLARIMNDVSELLSDPKSRGL